MRGKLPAVSEKITRKAERPVPDTSVDPDEVLPEYDFSRAKPNKFASRYVTGSLVVVLEPDVAAAFPAADLANEALRALAGLIQKHKAPGARP